MSTFLSNICQNCDFENESTFQFCPNCGQKNTNGRVTFSALWSEFKDAALNVDSRTWRTLKNLFVPGKLTTEYFAGKHRQYVHPLRVLIVTSIVAIIAMNFQDFDSATNNNHDVKERITQNYERQRLFRIINDIAKNTNASFPTEETAIVTDSIVELFRDSIRMLLLNTENYQHGDKYNDSININYYAGSGGESDWVSKRDFLTMDEDQLVETYKNDKGTLDRLFLSKK